MFSGVRSSSCLSLMLACRVLTALTLRVRLCGIMAFWIRPALNSCMTLNGQPVDSRAIVSIARISSMQFFSQSQNKLTTDYNSVGSSSSHTQCESVSFRLCVLIRGEAVDLDWARLRDSLLQCSNELPLLILGWNREAPSIISADLKRFFSYRESNRHNFLLNSDLLVIFDMSLLCNLYWIVTRCVFEVCWVS